MLFETDVVIVGAGPAGTTTSHFLSKYNIPHIIIEKAEFPRDKICGDGLSGKVVGVLQDLHPEWIDELQADTAHFLDSWGVRFVAPNGKALDLPFRIDQEKPKRAPGFIGKRIHFDAFLFSKLHRGLATAFTGMTLVDVKPAADGVILRLEKNGEQIDAKARVLIAADGDHSIVARKLAGQRLQPSEYYAGVRAYFSNVDDLHPQNFIELHFLKEFLPGYFWIFPLPNRQANVGVGILASDLKKQRLGIKEILMQTVKHHPEISRRFKHARMENSIKGWRLPLATRKRPLSGNHFLLTGDAGALIDPFTGEGIGNAMLSGQIAAGIVQKAVKARDFSAGFLRQYDEAVYAAMWDELKLSQTLQKLVRKRWLFNFVINRILGNAQLKETFSTMFHNLDNRAKLSSPWFYLRMLLNI